MSTKADEYYHFDVGSNMGICGVFIDPVANRERGERKEPTEVCPECVKIAGVRPGDVEERNK